MNLIIGLGNKDTWSKIMSKNITYDYSPNYAVHPGEILEETIISRRISKSELAKRCGLSAKTVSLIFTCTAPVTPETALQFEKVLGVSADIWNNLDSNYRLFSARSEKLIEFGHWTDWINNFPLKTLKQKKILSDTKNVPKTVNELLAFFGVANRNAWNSYYGNIAAAFRKSPSYESDPGAIAAWLRLAEIFAEEIEVDTYNAKKFRNSLNDIRNLTKEEPGTIEKEIFRLCKESGVSFVILKEFPKTRLHGATRWVNKQNPMLALTVRYKYEGQFWFSLFHEAAHILLHERSRVFIDHEKPRLGDLEDEANRFAADFLIPPDEYRCFTAIGKYSKKAILEFSESINISPGIVVGRLQHDKKIFFNQLVHMKKRYVVID